jgi:DNA-binding response OmpR family regulator
MPSKESPGCRVLIVEDEATIARNCVTFFELQGYTVDIAHDGAAAIARLTSDTFDVVVLDLGLPRIDGKRVLDHLRRQLALATPVLVLTARDELDTKLACFSLGADDYLAKPFSLAELEARVAALHRRATGAVVADVASAGALRLDRRTRSVSVQGAPVHLAPRPMRILDCLLRDPGRVVTRSELESLLWPDGDRDSDVLRSQVHLLRRALSDAGYDGLETVHGIGYRLRVEGVSQ